MKDPRKTLKRNWPYMLTGTLLSVFLWMAVSADTVAQQTLLADLVIINSDRRFVLTEREPDTDVVSVVFTGRAGDLAALMVSRPQLYVAIDSVEALNWEIELTPELVTGRGGRELEDVRPISVNPDRLELHFEPRAQKVVSVVPQVDVTTAPGYVLADSPRAEPGAVSMQGPDDAVARIDSVFTVPIVRDGITQSISVEVPLDKPEPREAIAFSAENVRVTVTVEERTERIFPAVPLSVTGADVSNVRVEPSLVNVRISGPRSLVEAVRPESLSPRIELSGPGDLGRRLPVTLPAPSPFVSVSIDPDSAQVVRQEPRAGADPSRG